MAYLYTKPIKEDILLFIFLHRRIEITFVSARPMSEVGFRNEKAAEKPPGGELTNNNTQKDVNDNTFKEATAGKCHTSNYVIIDHLK